MASRSELQRALWDRRAERAARFDHPPPPMTLQTLLKQPRPVLPAPVLRSSAGSLRGGSAGSLRGARPTRAAEAAAIVRATTPSLDWSSQQRAPLPRTASVPTPLPPQPPRHHVAVALPSPAAMPLGRRVRREVLSVRAGTAPEMQRTRAPFWKQPKADDERDVVAPSRQLPALFESDRVRSAAASRPASRPASRARPPEWRPPLAPTLLVGTESGWAVAAGSARAAAAAAAAAAVTPAAAPPTPPAPPSPNIRAAARAAHLGTCWPGSSPEKGGGSEVTVRFTLDAATGVASASIERTVP